MYWERFEENDVRLVIPVSATVISGFEPNEDLLQWFVVREGLAFGGETLPLDNSDFGERWVILTFNGQDVHAAKIEIFFPATGNKHPEDVSAAWGYAFWEGEKEGWPNPLPMFKTPNWFYYYWKAHPDPEVRFGVRWSIMGKNARSFYYPGDQHVYISDDVWEGTVEGERGCWTTWYITSSNIVDFEHVRAIDAFVRAVIHEKTHKILWEESQQPGWVDSDGDGVSDQREIEAGLNPNNPNTFDLSSVEVPKPPTYSFDEELYCSLQEYGKFGDKTKDWADDHGLNYGGQKPCLICVR
ncbi:hypothetical protein HRbin17_01669 [bacterium HR17]|uniref:Uncharacterized protein n=1 Tax=Candidatus Fervidibacter japonicus TaxID=2035412 RepID=A0A2H5XD83_9BACT|nr:hypothetical protein HRbin17_01669 [bacterium HR17]